MSTQHRPLTANDLLSAGPLVRLGRPLFLHDTIDSTNAFLLARARDADDGAIAWAEFQSAGRGRLGRRWLAPRGSSILLSVLLIEPADSPLLTLAAALAAVSTCEAIDATTDCAPAVRWPNDIVLHRRKLGGVLAESCPLPDTPRAARQRALVIGIGVNCLQQAAHFPPELADLATSLEIESSQPISRASLAAALLARLDHWLVTGGASGHGWTSLLTTWRARCHDVGTRVTLEQDGRTYTGTALDISEEGDLIVELDQGARRRFASTTTTRGG